MKFYSIITDKDIKNKIIDFIKDKEFINICGSKKIFSSGEAVGFLSNLNLNKVNLVKSLRNSVELTFDLDENCEKYIIIITDKLDDNLKYNIKTNLDLEKRSNLLDNFCNFYIVGQEDMAFDHPKVFFIKNFDEIKEKI